VVLLSLLQTGNAVLIGKGKLYKPVVSLGVGIIIKIVLSLILLKMPSLNIYGGAIGVIACYFVSTLINLFMIFNFKVKHENKTTCRREYAS
jgi:stage V sporulation protein B